MSEILTRDLAAGDLPAIPPLPPGLLDDIPDAFDAFADAFQAGLRPDPDLSISEWADKHRVLSGKSAAEPGPYRTSRAPFLREIMDSLSPQSAVQRVVFMKGAQIGGSEAGNNFLGFVIDCAPGPILAVQPTVETAKRFSKQRVDSLIESTAPLRAKVLPARARDSGNTILQKDFPGGTLVLTGANSAVGLRSMPARYLFLDEVDAYDSDVDGEGSPIVLAEQRTKTYSFRRKIFLVSTPKTAGKSVIEKEFLATDQRRYFVPCPHCGHMQWLKFQNLRWEKGRPETAAYYCEECGACATEAHKTAMLAAGEWRPTAECPDPTRRGYHVSSLYSPVGWSSWAEIADAWEKARGDVAELKSFTNTVLGETWQERGDAPPADRLMDRREPWPMGVVPEGVLALTAGADLQNDRIEAYLWGWGRGRERWLIDCAVFYGRPADAKPWDDLAAWVTRDWPRADGGTMRVLRCGVDTGGQDTTAAYGHLRRLSLPSVMVPLKGVDRWNGAAPVQGPSAVDAQVNGVKVRRGLNLWTVAVATFKAEFYRALWLARGDDGSTPPGWVHLSEGLDAERIRQLVAEELRTVQDRRGYARQEWAKVRERNEALDCAIYARAALWVAGADMRSEQFWEDCASLISAARAAVPVHASLAPRGRGVIGTGRRLI